MLFNQDPRGQTLNRVVFMNRHFALRDDRPAIQSLINKMDRAAAVPGAVLQRLPHGEL